MSVPIYTTLVTKMMAEVDVLLNHYLYNGYTGLADYLATPLAIAITLYVVLLGYSIIGGWVRLSFAVFIQSLIKFGVIYLFAMNWGVFSQYLVGLLFDVSSQLGNMLASTTPAPLPSIADDGIQGALQSILSELWDIGQWVWNKASLTNWSAMISAVGIWISSSLLIGFALFQMIVAKCMLSILLVTAPLFISFTLFSPTAGFFDRWIGACASYAFVMIFVSAAIGLSTSIDQWIIADTYTNKAASLSMIDMLTLVLVAFICLGIIKETVSIAMLLGSSVSTFTSSSGVSSTIGGYLGGALATLSPSKSVAKHK